MKIKNIFKMYTKGELLNKKESSLEHNFDRTRK